MFMTLLVFIKAALKGKAHADKCEVRSLSSLFLLGWGMFTVTLYPLTIKVHCVRHPDQKLEESVAEPRFVRAVY